ncbi:acyl-CoA dehydrogenase C-terminal domain-containing protein [Pseudomonas sp. BN417]|uniref:acyl-CoA dehydrogenase C-terminal domain-containing protein n=1 Tax=Pseudomonas sp. BN417 TaxID=2567890 RepID=UPI00245669FA|nr:acyl-CoA dehydrogenase C-terminal domain-containing protein [Pseudomonas sp. BN417]
MASVAKTRLDADPSFYSAMLATARFYFDRVRPASHRGPVSLPARGRRQPLRNRGGAVLALPRRIQGRYIPVCADSLSSCRRYIFTTCHATQHSYNKCGAPPALLPHEWTPGSRTTGALAIAPIVPAEDSGDDSSSASRHPRPITRSRTRRIRQVGRNRVPGAYCHDDVP